MDFFMALLDLVSESFSASIASMSLCWFTDLTLSATNDPIKNMLMTVLLFVAFKTVLATLFAISILFCKEEKQGLLLGSKKSHCALLTDFGLSEVSVELELKFESNSDRSLKWVMGLEPKSRLSSFIWIWLDLAGFLFSLNYISD